MTKPLTAIQQTKIEALNNRLPIADISCGDIVSIYPIDNDCEVRGRVLGIGDDSIRIHCEFIHIKGRNRGRIFMSCPERFNLKPEFDKCFTGKILMKHSHIYMKHNHIGDNND